MFILRLTAGFFLLGSKADTVKKRVTKPPIPVIHIMIPWLVEMCGQSKSNANSGATPSSKMASCCSTSYNTCEYKIPDSLVTQHIIAVCLSSVYSPTVRGLGSERMVAKAGMGLLAWRKRLPSLRRRIAEEPAPNVSPLGVFFDACVRACDRCV